MPASRPNEPPLPEPLAYFMTWSTYGTWLPGDERGWTEYHHGWQLPDTVLQLEAKARMAEDACRLDGTQRKIVEEQIAETCQHCKWTLFTANCRSNHVHVVLFAPQHPIDVRAKLKAWATRRLKEDQLTRQLREARQNWWTERGSVRWINDEESLEMAVFYVRDGQDRKGEERP